MNVLIRKHLCFERTGKYMVLISPSDIFTDSFISFQMKTTFSNVTYIFLDNIAIDIIQPLRIILIILAAVFRTKMGILLTEDVLSFSLCESYLANKLKSQITTYLRCKNGLEFKNVTFYDYEAMMEMIDV